MSSFASTGRTLNEHLGQYQASASEHRPLRPHFSPCTEFSSLDRYQMEKRPLPYRVELGRGQQGKELFNKLEC